MYRANQCSQVLLVDDDASLVDLTATYLERESDQFAIETETDARDGLARLDDDQIDCIVSDYQMPEMDGLAFLEEVRAEYPDLPFILFTGKGSEEVAAKAINAGVDAYIQKETGTGQYAVLAQHVTTLVEKHRAEQRLDYLAREKHITDGGGTSVASEPSCWSMDTQSSAESVSMAVVEAVAEREDIDPVELTPPLYESINPDALDALFDLQSTEQDQTGGSVAFTYQGYTVTVFSDGQINLEE